MLTKMTFALVPDTAIIGRDEPVLVTGAAGFVGSRVVASLLERGFSNVRCLVRPSSDLARLDAAASPHRAQTVQVRRGTLLSRQDCIEAARNVAVVYHLAAGTAEKSYADAFLHSVVTTRNLLDAVLEHARLKRFVNLSSFAVYTNRDKPLGDLLDESCPIEARPQCRGDAYCYAKVRQDELVTEYGRRHGVPYTLVRPGAVYGPGKAGISGRVGSGALGIFLHLGGSNVLPLTYVDNCADAIVLAGLVAGVDGEVLNVVDDDLPTSRSFLHDYKRQVRPFTSIPIPRSVSYALCGLWERYSSWPGGQLPPVFNRGAWHAYWKGARYTNRKLKDRLGWSPRISTAEGLRRYFESCRRQIRDAA